MDQVTGLLICESQRLKVKCDALFRLTPCQLVVPPGLRRFSFVYGGGGGVVGVRQWLNIVCKLTCGSEGLTVVNRGHWVCRL